VLLEGQLVNSVAVDKQVTLGTTPMDEIFDGPTETIGSQGHDDDLIGS
jgi:hypothetical protein